jgi:GT2 family glycosyltransferase
MLGGVFLMIANLTVPVLNRYDLLERMLASIDYPVKHLLVIDNGGGIESLDQPDAVEKLTVWNMPANFGVAASWNLGIKAFRNDDVFFFASNDMRFQPGGLKALGRAERDAVTLSHQMPYFHTFAVGVDVVARVGLFDESFFPAYCEDIDFLWRCEREGITVNRAVIPTSHDNSSTIGSDLNYQSANTVTYPQNAELLKWKRNNMKAEALPFNVMRWRRQDWR